MPEYPDDVAEALVDEAKIAEYFRLSRRYARAYGKRKGSLRYRLNRLWESMNDEERQTVSKRWRDPS